MDLLASLVQAGRPVISDRSAGFAGLEKSPFEIGRRHAGQHRLESKPVGLDWPHGHLIQQARLNQS